MIPGWLTHQSHEFEPQVCACSQNPSSSAGVRGTGWGRCGLYLVRPGPSLVLGWEQLSGSVTALEHTGVCVGGRPTRPAGAG